MSNQNIQCNYDEQGIDLRVLISVVRKRILVIFLLTALAVTTSGLLSYYVLVPVYEAKALLLVKQVAEKPQSPSQKDDASSILNNMYRIPAFTINDYVGQIRSVILMQRVIDKLQLAQRGYTNRSLAGQIKAAAAKDSSLIEVTVSNSDPVLAASIANTLIQEFMALISEKNMEAMDRSIKFLQDQMEKIKGEMAAAADPSEKQRLQGVLALLNDGITRSQIARSIDLGSASLVIVSPAIAPHGPVKPDKNKNMAMAFLLGLVLSIALIFGLEFMDNTVKTPEDVTAYVGLPVLGLIPSMNSRTM